MKFDLNEAIRDVLNFLKTHWKPSLAKYIVWPSMTVGLASVSVPLWIEVVNWVLINQNFFPDYRFSISQPNYLLGASLIFLSVLVHFVDAWLKKSSKLPDQLNELPSHVANEITTRMKSAGFTAQHLQDEKIEEISREITLLRFFGSFSKEEKADALAESIIDGELAGGTPQAKAKALALLARYLCVGERIEQAKNWLSISKRLCPTEEAEIAQAFIDAIGSNNVDTASNLLKRSNPSNYAAFFMIKKTVEGSEAAIDWFESASLSIQDLDNDGKVVLVSTLLSEHQWKKALIIVQDMGDESVPISPALAQLSAFALLVNAIKSIELREIVMNSVPLAADRFPLADDCESIALRNRAVELFKTCSRLARSLSAEDVADMADNYVLWLELRNSETHEQAKAKLQSYFVSYTQKTLEYLPLAFAFGVDIDFESIEKEVNRQTALSAENNPILGLARFVLAQTKKSFPAVVGYIARYRSQMERAINPIAISMLEIEALAKSGLVDDAEQLLQKIESSGAPDAEVRNLKNIIESAKGEDPIALTISQYQQSNATSDLSHLVDLLEKEKLRDKYYSYCRELFDRTGQESDAIRACNAASSLGRFTELHQFLSDRMDIVKRSDGLQAHWAWSLFRMGDLSAAKKQVTLLEKSKILQTDLKTLDINLSIFSGDWESLSIHVEDSWNRREELTADELLQTAQLAKVFSPQRVRQILGYCTTRYRDDPQVLASSYFTATTMGWEDNQETSEWINKAIVLSNEDGPLQKASLEELKGMIADSKEKNERIYKAYYNGDAPIFTVAELLNRTMSDFYLVQPLENRNSKDVRRKNLVAVFHGARNDQVIVSDSIAVDASSALVIGNIGLLKHVVDCFERIVIPHSFFRWLFEEKQKVSFHQPSQIKNAVNFERLISDGKISVFHPKRINNPELALDVGDELAFMLEEANAETSRKSQDLVVCSYPVYKVGDSFREVEVDLSSYDHCLISCSQLIEKLKDMAVITEAQSLNALNYLHQHVNEWPSSPDIESGSRLFLDSLSITYLMTVEMLDKLTEAGFEVYVCKGARDKYRSLVNYNSIINKADLIIEDIRSVFSNGLVSGKVILSEMPVGREQGDASKKTYLKPTEEIFEAVKFCDAALIDDRFMNRHGAITFGDRSVPIFTSLDFVETLHHKGHITEEQKLDARASLRELGFEFVNISSGELDYHLKHSAMVDYKLKPTKQLRLIRDSLLLLRISGLVQLPRDAQWLRNTLIEISKAIAKQWSVENPIELCRVRSCWLYELLGYREWAQAHQIRNEEGMAYLGEALKVLSILTTPESIPSERTEDYKSWLDEFVLAPLKELDPLSYKNVIDSVKQQVKSLYHQSKLEED